MFKLMLIVYLYLALQMFAVWMIAMKIKNPAIVDMTWSLGIMVAGLIYLCSADMTLRSEIISALLIIWSLRLAGYLWYTRLRLGLVDKRYLQISEHWTISRSWGYFLNFQLQAIFIMIISCVFIFVRQFPYPYVTGFDLFGILLVIVGIVGETIADLQLHRFKSLHKKQICDCGLWALSRHPNYFFDWVTWCGFTVFSLQTTGGFISLISPIMLYIIFTQITGPITERGSLQSRGQAFVAYQKKTPMFFPWPFNFMNKTT